MATAIARVVPNDVLMKETIDNLGCQNKWIPILNNSNNIFDFCVEEIAKFAVEAYNVIHIEGKFKYKNLEGGWYFELKDLNKLLFHLHITVTDFHGVDIKVEVVVSVTYPIFGSPVMDLVSFLPLLL